HAAHPVQRLRQHRSLARRPQFTVELTQQHLAARKMRVPRRHITPHLGQFLRNPPGGGARSHGVSIVSRGWFIRLVLNAPFARKGSPSISEPLGDSKTFDGLGGTVGWPAGLTDMNAGLGRTVLRGAGDRLVDDAQPLVLVLDPVAELA